MTNTHYYSVLDKVKKAVEIKRVCNCPHQFADGSLPGCKMFTKKPDACWLDPKITEPLPPEAFTESIREVVRKAAIEQVE